MPRLQIRCLSRHFYFKLKNSGPSEAVANSFLSFFFFDLFSSLFFLFLCAFPLFMFFCQSFSLYLSSLSFFLSLPPLERAYLSLKAVTISNGKILLQAKTVSRQYPECHNAITGHSGYCWDTAKVAT